MASKPRAADDAETIRARMAELRRGADTALSGNQGTGVTASTQKPERPRAADDFAAIAKAKGKRDVAYPKS